jgi:hypothetical protein
MPIIIRGIGAGADKKALKMLESMLFTPGVQGGRLVKLRMRQTVHFRLHLKKQI